MKKLAMILLAVLALCLASCALAEETKITFTNERGRTLTVSSNAEAIDLGDLILARNGSDYNNFISFLRQLPNLKKVDMYASEVYANQVETLAANFPNIEFGWTMLIPCTNPTHPERTPHRIRTDQTAFSTLHNNQCSLHNDSDLAILRFCRNLLALDIGHNAISNLNFLYDLPHLKVLILGKNNISDITPLGSLKELEYLELFSNKVTDISPMAGCESLVDLNIANNSITDFTPLTGLTHLRRLFVYNSALGSNNGPISNSIVGMLRSSLPGCRIDNATGGAHGAWREHHRYYTLLEMFWERENVPAQIHKYVPFKNLD